MRNPFLEFRKALRDDKEAYDDLLVMSSMHENAQAKSGLARGEAVLLSMMLEHEKEILRIMGRLSALSPK